MRRRVETEEISNETRVSDLGRTRLKNLPQELVQTLNPVSNENRIVIVPDPTFRRQGEHRVGEIPGQLLLQVIEIVVSTIKEPVRDLAHSPVATMLYFQLVNL